MAHSITADADDPRVLSQQNRDWIDSLEDVLQRHGPDRVSRLMRHLQMHAQKRGVVLPVTSQTPYLNTIPTHREPPYPGNPEIERRIKSIIRWNAMAMVVRANKQPAAPGGHISSYSSLATLYEVGHNHFFRGKDSGCGGDAVYFQGHSSPGNYARAFVEGRLTERNLINFRREMGEGGGLSSYPHPWLMPDFWEYPTVSMGLGPIMSIYRARFMRYLDDRGIRPYKGARVWSFVGDGETDEPETLGAITLASREKLDNLTWVINCNLQRLDGPVRGNGKIIQELEAIFRGAGWNVIKVLWGHDWDPLFEQDVDNVLLRRLEEMVDGQYQKVRVEGGAHMREQVFGGDERLERMAADYTDDELWHLRLGGHDARRIHAAYKAAVEHEGAPTVILAQTIKGYGLGEAGEGKNITHQAKKLNEEEMLYFRDRFDIPITDEQITDVAKVPFYRPAEDSIEMKYLRERQAALGGPVPIRKTVSPGWDKPDEKAFTEFDKGSGKREIATTMAFVRILQKLMRDKQIGKHIVPIIPDEARTFGMDGLFSMVGIYSHVGQLYEPVDRDNIAYYKEAVNGQIIEEGINEAGSMSSFIAAGTAHAAHQTPMIPFYVYYSMFGYQRIGDLVWCAGDMRTRGFMMAGTAGRTTLNGEGLQHQDGHNHLLFSVVPNVRAYDPAYGYEIATIIRDGIQRMYYDEEDIFYYITLQNEPYTQPPRPQGVDEGILKGMYKLREAEDREAKTRVQLLGSASILRHVIEAQGILAEKYGVAADVWSVTSYTELRRDALAAERWNMLHPDQNPRTPYVTRCLGDAPGPVVASSDYLKSLPDLVDKWVPQSITALGTDGFGRSESRENLRHHFEVDARWVVVAALHALSQRGEFPKEKAARAIRDLDIDPEKFDPLYA